MYKVLDCVFFSSNELRNFGLWQKGWRKGEGEKKKEALPSWVFAYLSPCSQVCSQVCSTNRLLLLHCILADYDVNVEIASKRGCSEKYTHSSWLWKLELVWNWDEEKRFGSTFTRFSWQTQNHGAVTFHLVPCHEDKAAVLSSPGQQSVFQRSDCWINGQKREGK